MKNITLALALILGVASTAHADFSATDFLQQDLQLSIAGGIHAENVVNWKVGEFSEYNLEAGGFGNVGTMRKAVTSEEGNAIWLTQDMSGMIGTHKAEALIDRATGKVLKMRQDGKDQDIPDDKLEIISQEKANITVPAGSFDTIHIMAKSAKVKQLDMWMNPRDITLDGAAQEIIDSGQIAITLKLTKFGGR